MTPNQKAIEKEAMRLYRVMYGKTPDVRVYALMNTYKRLAKHVMDREKKAWNKGWEQATTAWTGRKQ